MNQEFICVPRGSVLDDFLRLRKHGPDVEIPPTKCGMRKSTFSEDQVKLVNYGGIPQHVRVMSRAEKN